MPEPIPTYQSIPTPERQTLDRLAIALDRVYNHTGRLIWRAFLQGFVSAIGASVGTLFVFALLGFLFKQLGGPAFLQSMITNLSQNIVQAQAHALFGK